MKAITFLEKKTLTHYESHQFDNYLHEEGEYIKLEDVKKYAELYYQEKTKRSPKIELIECMILERITYKDYVYDRVNSSEGTYWYEGGCVGIEDDRIKDELEAELENEYERLIKS